MDRQILVPLDGSTLAEAVLPHAITLARSTGSAIRLLRVTVPPDDSERLGRSCDLVRSRIYVAYIAERLRTMGLTVHTTISEGDPATRIVALTDELGDSSMIAMATHARRGASRWILGSVAEAVVHAAPVPVLLVRSREVPVALDRPVTYGTILVPLDGTTFAEHALDQAHTLALAHTAALHLVAVAEAAGAESPTDDGVAAQAGVVPDWVLADAHAQVQQMIQRLHRAGETLRTHGLEVQTVVTFGRPAEQILPASDAAGADVIVMATHARAGLRRFWLGSVAIEVLAGTDLPLLLVGPHANERLLATGAGWRGRDVQRRPSAILYDM